MVAGALAVGMVDIPAVDIVGTPVVGIAGTRAVGIGGTRAVGIGGTLVVSHSCSCTDRDVARMRTDSVEHNLSRWDLEYCEHDEASSKRLK
uniref:2,3,4,5-tetrahydropyridine-2,6-dicarboxylate N-succinyltransferase n=1 Tax=Angiostrongylus cantonensis TaxID=6313 RepID=A0A0K0D8P7_ANGCA